VILVESELRKGTVYIFQGFNRHRDRMNQVFVPTGINCRKPQEEARK